MNFKPHWGKKMVVFALCEGSQLIFCSWTSSFFLKRWKALKREITSIKMHGNLPQEPNTQRAFTRLIDQLTPLILFCSSGSSENPLALGHHVSSRSHVCKYPKGASISSHRCNTCWVDKAKTWLRSRQSRAAGGPDNGTSYIVQT